MNTKLFTLLLSATLMSISLTPTTICQSLPPVTQLSSAREYSLKNKLSNKLLDVRDGSKTPGAQIWQHDLNYSDAQRFRIQLSSSYGNDAYVIRPQTSSNFFVSLRHNLSLGVETGFASGVVVGAWPTTVLGNPVIDSGGLDPNIFKLVQDRRYDIRPIVTAATPISLQPRYQIWKFVPVPNESSTYFIESLAFTERMALQATSVRSGSQLRLSRFNGSDAQKWIVLPTTPEPPSNLELKNFVWKELLIVWYKTGTVKGELEWIDNSSNELEFEIQMKRKDDGFFSDYWTLGDVDANRKTFKISHRGRKGEGREHCFRVIARNKWGDSASSNEVCGTPVPESTPPPPPPPPPGVEAIGLYNCHNGQKTVRVWIYDHTTNSGEWEDRGTIASSWNGSSCPPDATLVLKVPLANGHQYTVKAIDCGDDPPNLTDGACVRFQSQLIFGKIAGGIFMVTIN